MQKWLKPNDAKGLKMQSKKKNFKKEEEKTLPVFGNKQSSLF